MILAAVLLLLAFALVTGTRALFDTVGDEGGIIDAEKAEEVTIPAQATPTTVAAAPEETTTSTTPPKPPNEVTVRVGNGAQKSGVAGRGTDILEGAGYLTLGAKTSTIKLETSTVYYVEGFAADAEVIASLLNVDPVNIAPMPADTGIAQDTALIVVILGGDTTL